MPRAGYVRFSAGSYCASVPLARAQISRRRRSDRRSQSLVLARRRSGGPGLVVAARMAVEDAGGSVSGSQSRSCSPTIRTNPISARRLRASGSRSAKWIWRSVSTIPPWRSRSSTCRRAQPDCHCRRVGSTAFTGKAGTPTEASWIYDSYALTTSSGEIDRRGRALQLVLHHRRLLSVIRWRPTPPVPEGGRRQGRRQRAASLEHSGFQFVFAAGTGIGRQVVAFANRATWSTPSSRRMNSG